MLQTVERVFLFTRLEFVAAKPPQHCYRFDFLPATHLPIKGMLKMCPEAFERLHFVCFVLFVVNWDCNLIGVLNSSDFTLPWSQRYALWSSSMISGNSQFQAIPRLLSDVRV